MNKNTYHPFFTNLANPLKIDIVLNLRETPKNVTELSSGLGVEQSKVSHALSSLKCCHIVESKQKGKQRIYSLNKKTILPILKIIDKHTESFCNKINTCDECK